ncbi:MAG: hypothetical protein WC120_05020 [Parcubacteria group bacterium]
MEKIPGFIKEFSKQNSQEERDMLASKIKRKRTEHFSKKREDTADWEKAKEIKDKFRQHLDERLENIKLLENEIDDLSNSWFKRIFNHSRLEELEFLASNKKKVHNEAKKSLKIHESMELSAFDRMNNGKNAQELNEAREMLKNFYEEQKEEWENSAYSKEDIRKYFSEENLLSLSLDEYSLLLRRFPNEMVTHVTRQGIRDHTGHIFHTANEGVYSDSFTEILRDGKLRSPLSIHLIKKEKEKAIEKYLRLDTFKDKKSALSHLSHILAESRTERQGEPGSYTDRMAVHFATEQVADAYYGSEKGNEIFIAYPSAHIASQYYFSGQLTSPGGGYWNDQWVWANEEKGMDLNAGIIFIPKEARVDPKTGSRYELDENKMPLKNLSYINKIERLVSSPDFDNIAKEAMLITGKMNQHWSDPTLDQRNREILEKLIPLQEKLAKDYGITDQRLQFTILRYPNMDKLESHKRMESEGRSNELNNINSSIESVLKEGGLLFYEATDTITSEDFWKMYFAKNQPQKPYKVIYYEGADPTYALLKWKRDNKITKKSKTENIGFSERNINRDDSRAIAGLNRFATLAKKVVEDHFNARSKP